MKRYLWFVIPALGLAGVVLGYLLFNLSDTLVYYRTPTEVRREVAADPQARLRLGGQVQVGSLVAGGGRVAFVIADETSDIPVEHTGTPPQLFQEGGGVVVEGTWDGTVFRSDVMIIKHDEQYRTEDGEIYTPPTDAP
ncbi:MAG: cytochrome c maturation protein CcmE [Acidimicrobiia bacterium]|nr:cytochrome c maturation protein CcmE [Acidimicrobiia bacterium]